jgi:hypothetical protein
MDTFTCFKIGVQSNCILSNIILFISTENATGYGNSLLEF